MRKIIGILLVLPLAALVFMGAGCSGSDSSSSATPKATISYNGSKFFPMIVNIKPGDTILFKNESNTSVQIQSNPHPAHTDNQEFNIGLIEAGKSKSVTIRNKGVWGYHNHLNQLQVGSVIVQE